MREDSPVTCALNGTCHRITVFGAIGTPLAKPVFYLAKSTNEEDFLKFLNKVKEAVSPTAQRAREKPVILLDNHSAHKTQKSLKRLNQYFQPLFQTPHSC